MQHATKGIYWIHRQILGNISSYCKYVYLKNDSWEILPSIVGRITTQFLVLGDTGRRSLKRVTKTTATNSSYYQYTKFTEKPAIMVFRGGGALKNLGLPKARNGYGNRGPVLVRNFGSKGGQQVFSLKVTSATGCGFELLKELASGNLEPIRNVYRIVYDPEILKASYNKLKSNPASMTVGSDNKDLNSLQISNEYFNNLSNKLKSECYKPVPIKEVLISKSGNGNEKRPLGILSIEDRIVQQSLLFLLEAVFEKNFNDRSYGFRPKRDPHTACKNLRTWKGVSWFVKGDIVNYFSRINHQKLINLVGQKIQDQQVIDLLWKCLRAGVIVDKKLKTTTVGIPQGAVISPILSNIYLHELDVYVDKLKKELDTKKTSETNPEYTAFKSLLRSKKGLEKKNGYKQLRTIKSTVRVGLKLYYLRYCDDWLVGIWGSKSDVVKIRQKIQIFLKDKLDLELSLEKTKILHAGKQKTHFLGYDIYSPTPKEFFFEKGKIKKRASHVTIYIDAPYNKIKERLITDNFLEIKKGKWFIKPITHWINYNHAEILYRYNWIIRGYLNYYSHVNNLYIFHKLIFVLHHSCALTLGRKLKLRSRKKVFKKFGRLLRDPKSQLTLAIPPDLKSNLKDYRLNSDKDPLKIVKWSIRTQHLIEGPCVGCGATSNIEIHHVNKLANLDKNKTSISRIMATLGRKQVPVCSKCHKDIHSGRYDKNVSPRKSK